MNIERSGRRWSGATDGSPSAPSQRGEERREHAELDGRPDRVVVGVGERTGQVSHRWDLGICAPREWVEGGP